VPACVSVYEPVRVRGSVCRFWGLWCLRGLGGVGMKQIGELAKPFFFPVVL
jgi:hypothetical protein